MIRISKNEAKKLREMGVKNGENGISTTSATRTNYLCESRYCLEKLNQIRKY